MSDSINIWCLVMMVSFGGRHSLDVERHCNENSGCLYHFAQAYKQNMKDRLSLSADIMLL